MFIQNPSRGIRPTLGYMRHEHLYLELLHRLWSWRAPSWIVGLCSVQLILASSPCLRRPLSSEVSPTFGSFHPKFIWGASYQIVITFIRKGTSVVTGLSWRGCLQQHKVHRRHKIRVQFQPGRNTCTRGRESHSMKFTKEADFIWLSA